MRVEVIAFGLSWSEFEKAGNLQGWSTKKSHSLGASFLAFEFSKDVTQFYGIILAMTFDLSRISKTNLEISVEYLQSHFHNHSTCIFSGTDQW